MKEIVAVVRRHNAASTKSELSRCGCEGYSVFPVLGRGKQRGIRGSENGHGGMAFLPRVLFNAVVENEQVDETIEAIIRANQTGEFGDGRVFVMNVGESYRISDKAVAQMPVNAEPAKMKMIKAIIRPEKEMEVTRRLEAIQLPAMTKWDVLGRGRQRGIQVGGAVYGELSKLCVMLVVKEEEVEQAVQAIIESAQTGNPGDGRIFVSDVQMQYTIRTGLTGAYTQNR